MLQKLKVPLFFMLIIGIISGIKVITLYIGSDVTPAQKESKNVQNAGVLGVVAKQRQANEELYINATLLPNEFIEIYPEISGRVMSIRFTEGGTARKGDTLVCLDNAEWQAELKQLEVQSAQLAVQEKRMKKLLEVQGVSQESYDQIYFQLKGLEAQTDLVNARLRKTVILAPFNGVLGLRNVSLGAIVNPSTRLTTLQQVRPLKIEFPVPEKYAWKIKNGDKIQFTIQATDKIFEATVYATEALVQSDTRTLLIRAISTQNDPELLPGSYAKIKLAINENEDAIMIPTMAIIPVLKGQKVFIVKEGIATLISVQTGLRSESEIQVVNGLSPGDTVITTGIMGLKPGTPVSVSIP
jgi:membrane fusion protein, multidrug efflux system